MEDTETRLKDQNQDASGGGMSAVHPNKTKIGG